jgi:hypothetical protein
MPPLPRISEMPPPGPSRFLLRHAGVTVTFVLADHNYTSELVRQGRGWSDLEKLSRGCQPVLAKFFGEMRVRKILVSAHSGIL